MNTLGYAMAVLSAGMMIGTAHAADGCDPKVVHDDTSFPMQSQLRGQKGIVFLDVVVDASGRAASVDLVDSSGYRLLDRAAQESVIDDWQFDVSTCERKDLPVKHRIAVEYRNEEY